jgi:phosphatidylglycerophosphate synthase
MGEYTGGDRRPIASRNLRIFQRMAGALARARMSANAISILGMIAGIAAGAILASTPVLRTQLGWTAERLGFLAAAVCIQLRLLANMLDGMVALASGQASALGELYNEIPDRISDTVILAGAGYALGAGGGYPALGWAAAAMALFVTYIRSVGKGMGVSGLFQGPMAKSHRMFLLTVACIYLAGAPDPLRPVWQFPLPYHPVGIMSIALAIVVLGGAMTALRRLGRIVRAVNGRGGNA